MNNAQSNSLLWWVVPNVLAGMPKPFGHNERRTSHGGALDGYDDDLPLLYSAGVRAVLNGFRGQSLHCDTRGVDPQSNHRG